MAETTTQPPPVETLTRTGANRVVRAGPITFNFYRDRRPPGLNGDGGPTIVVRQKGRPGELFRADLFSGDNSPINAHIHPTGDGKTYDIYPWASQSATDWGAETFLTLLQMKYLLKQAGHSDIASALRVNHLVGVADKFLETCAVE